MTLEPQQVLCVKHVEGLGFDVQNKKKKEAVIDLSYKDKDPRNLLSLAYYSMALSSIFLPEGTVAMILESHKTISRDALYEKAKIVTGLLSMENLYPMGYHEHGFESRIGFFMEKQVIGVNEGGHLAVVNSSEANTLLEFFVGITKPIFDTYLVMLLTIE
jgi:glycerol-3-phosphate O-acyltransferase